MRSTPATSTRCCTCRCAPTVAPAHGDGLDEHDEEQREGDPKLVEKLDDVLATLRDQIAQSIAGNIGSGDEAPAEAVEHETEHEQLAASAHSLGELITEGCYQRLQSAELNALQVSTFPNSAVNAQREQHEEEDQRPERAAHHGGQRLRIHIEDEAGTWAPSQFRESRHLCPWRCPRRPCRAARPCSRALRK